MFLLLACTVTPTPSQARPVLDRPRMVAEQVLIQPTVRTHVWDGSGASPLGVCTGREHRARRVDDGLVALMDCTYEDGATMTLFLEGTVVGDAVTGTVTMTRDGRDHVAVLDSQWEDGLQLGFSGTWADPSGDVDYEGELRVR